MEMCIVLATIRYIPLYPLFIHSRLKCNDGKHWRKMPSGDMEILCKLIHLVDSPILWCLTTCGVQ